MSKNRVGGLLALKINGDVLYAKGNFTYGLGKRQKEAVLGADRVHGFKETPTIPFIEGEITDRSELDLGALQDTTDATVTLELSNGKVIVLREAWYASAGVGNSEEGNIECRFEGMGAEEIR